MKLKPRSFVVLCALLLAQVATAVDYQNPVLRGDFPDPSVIRVGEDYWATATASEWAPLFPILHSRDLINWELKGHVFSEKPTWSKQNYWAPELEYHKGTFFVYYTGRNPKDNRLHIAVATAPDALGPWTDHGPMIGQEDGSIDGIIETDEKGDRYMLWKNDGNSRNEPTFIYAQKLSEDGLKLVGEMKQLIRNDQPWEGKLIEGPDVLKRGDYFYMFYAGAGCCGKQCSYGTGVARSKSLLGPYEKYAKNPIVTHNDEWRCPGHGTIVSTPDGRDFFLYHAYDAKDTVYVGRQGVLDEIKWGADGWPSINQGRGTSALAKSPFGKAQKPRTDFEDDFTNEKLGLHWQWPHIMEPSYKIEKGELILRTGEGRGDNLFGSAVAVQTSTGNYAATTLVHTIDLQNGSKAGLFAFGDWHNAIGIVLGGGKAELIKRHRNKDEALASIKIPESEKVYLRMTATDGHKLSFAVWADGKWLEIGADLNVSGDFLPPWDRGVRVALTAGGSESATARFDWLRVINQEIAAK
ncbi:MAG: family 43 glycosylhydrolase [Verrucomicrobia bacterium]|nr:family 43 glycosylhydrolase [Verrucomicrobiota bacterium]